MNFENIYTELEKCGTDKNVKAYIDQGAKGDLFGVNIEDLQKIKSSVLSSGNLNGTNHSIAKKLWQTRNLDARILACMIADKNEMTRNDANQWVSVINYHYLADCFAELIAQTRFGMDIMYLWIQSPNEYIKRVGFAIIDYCARHFKDRSDLFFMGFIQKIRQELAMAPDRAKEGMLKCLVSIGKRSNNLKAKVEETAIIIGSITMHHSKSKNINVKEYLEEIWDKK